jgi:hypothetical protein
MEAQDAIEIHGKTYNKCHISDRQWEECITPCSFCQVQEYCNTTDPFCKDERVCYIELSAIEF